MRDPRHLEFETLRKKAVALGSSDCQTDYRAILELIKSEFPIVRKAAAGALVKFLTRHPSVADLCRIPLYSAISQETGDQTRLYLVKAYRFCLKTFTSLDEELLRDLVRNPTQKDYVRTLVSEILTDYEATVCEREARHRHWCTRCRKPVSVEESAAGIKKYGKPYCHHCLQEREFEDIKFNHDVETAKRLRTTDDIAVQSKGEKRIGDWLDAHSIAYIYDNRIVVAGDIAMRPDFYLPEFDVYIEYWGMNTPEYLETMKKKQFLYQRDHKKLISLSSRDFDSLEETLAQKLSRYLKISGE